jgi:peptidyl-prolyl cis-trans isomerase SurA
VLFAAGVCAQPTNAPSAVVKVDRVVAIVNDEALTQYELDDARRIVQQQLKQQKVQPPAADVLDKQVLERLITQRALLQQAKEDGVKIDDSQVERAIQRIAQENKLSAEEFRKALAQENIPYAKYRDDIRNEMLVQRLREREVDSKVQVSDAEVDQYLATLKAQNAGETEYRLAHILVAVPEQASSDWDRRPALASRRGAAVDQERCGFRPGRSGVFRRDRRAGGGSLGWRSGARLPTVFAEAVREQKVGTVSGVMRSAAGFHIVKLLEKRSHDDATLVDQTHARHILVRVNELTSEGDAKSKIERLKDRLDSGANFAELSKLNSEDASAAKGGDLGWLSPGDTVTESDKAMKKLQPNQVSPPVRTSFGWHLIEVLERRKQDVTIDRARNEAQTAIRQRKADEAFQDWVRQVRDKAFVEIRLDDR